MERTDRAILYDCDGIIVDSESLYHLAVRETFLPYGVNITEEEFVKRWLVGKTMTAGVIKDFGIVELEEEIRKRKADIVARMIEENLELMPYAREMLEMHHGRYPLGVVSSADMNEINLKLGKFDLLGMFEVLVTKEHVERKKPSPDPYVKGVESLSKRYPEIRPDNVIVLEDNPSGVKSGKGAGCIVVAYPNGFTSGLNFDEADAVISSLEEFNKEFVEGLFSSKPHKNSKT